MFQTICAAMESTLPCIRAFIAASCTHPWVKHRIWMYIRQEIQYTEAHKGTDLCAVCYIMRAVGYMEQLYFKRYYVVSKTQCLTCIHRILFSLPTLTEGIATLLFSVFESWLVAARLMEHAHIDTIKAKDKQTDRQTNNMVQNTYISCTTFEGRETRVRCSWGAAASASSPGPRGLCTNDKAALFGNEVGLWWNNIIVHLFCAIDS